MPSELYDAVIIGSGQAGNPLALALAAAGRRTALIEKRHVGGTCINEGCTPTKTMVANARVAYLARRGADYGVGTGPIAVDMTAVRARKRAMVDSFRKSSEKKLEAQSSLDLIMGEARFTAPHALEIVLNQGGTRALQAPLIFINTGSSPARPAIDGLDSIGALDSTSVMELDVVPAHLLVLGGGYVGLEFAQMFRRFGSRVTLVHHGSQLLEHEDCDVATAICEILREDGIEVLLDTETTLARRDGNGDIVLTVRNDSGQRELSGSHLLTATGRQPNTPTLNLAAAGIAIDDHGAIVVDECLQTGAPGIYALGDVKGGPAFTHISYDDFRIIRTNLLEGGRATTRGRMVPYTVYIDPQLGRIGLTEREAIAGGAVIGIASIKMAHVARALEMDETRGFIKIIVDTNSQRLLGASVLGVEGGEVMTALQIAMMGGLPYTALRDGIFAHPTLCEAFNNVFATLNPPAPLKTAHTK